MDFQFTEYTKFFIVMLALVDPVTIVPIYANVTASLSDRERKRLARRAALAVTIALMVALYLGEIILNIFGISLDSFRIAGGILLMIMALQLLYQPQSGQREATAASAEGGVESQVVVPIAIPLLAGPGAFSATIVYSLSDDSWQHFAGLSICLILIGRIVWTSLHLTGRFMRYLTPVSVAIVRKIMGLVLAAISVEFIASGIEGLFL